MKDFTNDQMFSVDLDDEYDFFVKPNVTPIPVGPMMFTIYRPVEERQSLLDHLFDDVDPAELAPIRSLDYNHETHTNVAGHEMSERGAIVTKVAGDYVVDLGYQVVSVPSTVANAYYANGLHTTNPDMAGYNAMIKAGVAPEIQVPTLKASDGQLKIVTDFVIGIDSMIARSLKESYRILVIGSSSESGVSGMAYGILSKMKVNCEIHLYDSCERDHQYVDGAVKYHYHRELWKYGDSVEHFDIVFDDAYVLGLDKDTSMREHLDPSRSILGANDYSIKSLKSDVQYFADHHIYCQAAVTPLNEHRCVKFKRVYGVYRPLFEGKCPFCTQLKYLLKRDYDWSFFEYFLRSHKRSCVSGFHVFPRHLRFKNDCCLHNQSSSAPNRLLLCSKHSSYITLIPTHKLSKARKIYFPKVPYDFDKLEFDDVIIESDSSSKNSVVSGDKLIFLVARSLIIKHLGQFFVTKLCAGEVTHECKSNFRFVAN